MPVVVTHEMAEAIWEEYRSFKGDGPESMKHALRVAFAMHPAPIPPDDWRTAMEARLSALEAAAKPAEPAFDGTFEAACRAVDEGKKVRRRGWWSSVLRHRFEGQWYAEIDGTMRLVALNADDRAATDWQIIHD